MVMDDAYPHLHPSAQSWADEPASERIRRIRTDRWIEYARAESALEKMEDLLAYPQRMRMPNLLLVGPTNNGKTMIVEKFRREHPQKLFGTGYVALVPVLKIQMPAGPDEYRFLTAIAETLAMDRKTSSRLAVLQSQVLEAMRRKQTRMLVVDELHNILSGTPPQQRRLLNLIRWLGNELQIPLIGVGTVEALRAVQSDDQLANRFEPFALPLWSDDDDFRRLLNTLEAVLPLRKRSDLDDPALANRIYAAGEGILGEIIAIVMQAAVEAVRSGSERITVRTIEAASFIRPSERRRVAV
jgi:type II secretory pathway predicted ATPase ExeA